MKQLSLAFNIFLLLAVGVLFYLHFSGMRHFGTNSSGCKSPAACASSKAPSIAYVEIDSINNNVTFIKQKQDELNDDQKQIEAVYQNQYKKLLAERDNFMKRGNSVTQQEAQDFQQNLNQQAQEMETNKQQQSQQLAEKGAKEMEDIQGQVRDFIKEYNQQKKYTFILETGTGLDYMLYKDSTLNITTDIVKGLNDKMKQSAN